MTKDKYTKRLEEILLTYGGYCSQQVEATDGDKQFFEAKQAIYKDLMELIDSCGESDLVIDGFVLEKKLEEYFK